MSRLGYYRRAKMLHEGAQMVVSEYAGVLPQTVTELKRIPGIGPYTGAHYNF
jgi:A/G-specific adenine glycosylase